MCQKKVCGLLNASDQAKRVETLLQGPASTPTVQSKRRKSIKATHILSQNTSTLYPTTPKKNPALHALQASQTPSPQKRRKRLG
jgi:hypothetical protein